MATRGIPVSSGQGGGWSRSVTVATSVPGNAADRPQAPGDAAAEPGPTGRSVPGMRTTRASHAPLQTTALLLAATAATHYLHGLRSAAWARIDTGDLLVWVASTPAEDVVAALLRLVAAAVCWWVGASLVLGFVARALRWRPAVTAVDRLSLPAIRRLADRLVGGSLVVATLTAPATALAAPPVPPTVQAEGALVPPGLLPPVDVGSPRPPTPRSAELPQRPPDLPPGERTVLVQRGDHLWSIATAEVARREGRDPSGLQATDIAPYWLEVVAANRHRLRSGDPDVLLPGERIVLPGGDG